MFKGFPGENPEEISRGISCKTLSKIPGELHEQFLIHFFPEIFVEICAGIY